MKHDKHKQIFIYTCVFFLFLCPVSCKNEAKPLAIKQSGTVTDSVQQMMAFIEKDVSKKGPVAWLTYFEKTPGFFMASDGQLVFPNNDSATYFIREKLVKQVRNIDLKWNDIRVDSLTNTLAGVAATWHEQITGYNNNSIPQSGYFTAIAERTQQGWRLRDAHWSIIKNEGK